MGLERICAWCKNVLSIGDDAGGATHTICEECQVKLQEELRQYNEKHGRNPVVGGGLNWYKLAAPPMPLNEIPEEAGGRNVNDRLTDEDVQYIEHKYPLKHKLGEGMIGAAYSTQDGKVLKITPSKEEYDLANMIKGQSYFAPVVKIYETEFLPNSRVYLVLRDKVKQLDGNQQSVVDNFNEFQTIIDSAEKQTEKEFTQITQDDIEQHFSPDGIETNQLLNSINWSGMFDRTATPQQAWNAISYVQSLNDIIEKAREFWEKISYFSAPDIRGENCGWDKDGDIVAFDFGNTIEANNTFNLKRFSQNKKPKKNKGLSKYEIGLLERIHGYYDQDKYEGYHGLTDPDFVPPEIYARSDIFHMDMDNDGSEETPSDAYVWYFDGSYVNVADEPGGTHSARFGYRDWKNYYAGRWSKKFNLITVSPPSRGWAEKASATLKERQWIQRDENAWKIIEELRENFGPGPEIVVIT